MNGENIHYYIYYQLDKCVIRERFGRVQGYVPWLLKKRYGCCLLPSDSQGGNFIYTLIICIWFQITNLDLLASNKEDYGHISEMIADNNKIESIIVLEGSQFIERFKFLSLRNNKIKTVRYSLIPFLVIILKFTISVPGFLFVANSPWLHVTQTTFVWIVSQSILRTFISLRLHACWKACEDIGS